MIWVLYNILFAIGFTLMLPHFIARMIRRGGYARNFVQRFGFYSTAIREDLSGNRYIWIQAVSVGEVFVAFRFMEEIRLRNPRARFILTTNTSTGYAIAAKRIAEQDKLFYFPLDIPSVMRRVLKKVKPVALILIECELWPNLIRLAKMQGVPIVLVNGRISEHSYSGYRKVRMFTRRILPMVDILCVQSQGDGDRLTYLGARPETVQVMGSAKYEVAQKDSDGEKKINEVLQAAGIRENELILLGGSTWPGEEKILLDTYQELRSEFSSLRLILAPRHVERAVEVIAEIESVGLRSILRSALDMSSLREGSAEEVLLVDTTGELKNFYPYATVIFIGKSLTQHGGQNVIEPAIYAKPVIVGPNMENFPVVINDFIGAGALIQVENISEFKSTVRDLLQDTAKRDDLGKKAKVLVDEKAGALVSTVDLMASFLGIQNGD